MQDSWRARPNLTLNYGLRWDLMQYWSEKYNQIPTFHPGPAIQGLSDRAGRPGLSDRPGRPEYAGAAEQSLFAASGLAYSPGTTDGLLGKIIGGPGKTSIRAGYGIFYSVIQGNTIAIDEPQPPYGLSYTSSGPPLFATPFINCGGRRSPRAIRFR